MCKISFPFLLQKKEPTTQLTYNVKAAIFIKLQLFFRPPEHKPDYIADTVVVWLLTTIPIPDSIHRFMYKKQAIGTTFSTKSQPRTPKQAC